MPLVFQRRRATRALPTAVVAPIVTTIIAVPNAVRAQNAAPPVPAGEPSARPSASARPARARLTLTSRDVRPGATIGLRYVANSFGCHGENISPALAWRGAPPNTRSYAVTVYDPDAPTGSGWWHWVAYNIPASTTSLPAGAGDPKGSGMPAGAVQGNTDFGMPGYGGPCPPPGDKPHRYVFTVYALKVDRLDLPATATAAFVGFNLHGNTLATASFTARYGR